MILTLPSSRWTLNIWPNDMMDPALTRWVLPGGAISPPLVDGMQPSQTPGAFSRHSGDRRPPPLAHG
jgi:hypothetical protein